MIGRLRMVVFIVLLIIVNERRVEIRVLQSFA